MPRIHLFPNWRSNPYTNMLSQSVIAEGWQVDGTLTCTQLVAELRLLRAGDVFHIQWTQPIVQDMPDARGARESLGEFQRAVRDARQRGVAVIWTIHNILPHAVKYRQLEIDLCAFLADQSDKIIQLNSYTAEAARDLYVLPPHKLVTLRHASYLGVYGEAPGQLEARAELGIPMSSPTVGFIGQIRHYKGVSTLLRAIEILSHRMDDLTLVLAGKTSPSEIEVLENEIPRSVRAVRRNAFVPDEDLGVWFAACDVAAFPYRNVLNSGSLVLAATYGVPAVAPAEPNFVSQYGQEGWVGLYSTAGDVELNLANKIESFLFERRQLGAEARRYAASYTTLDMSREYAEIVRGVVDGKEKAVSVEQG